MSHTFEVHFIENNCLLFIYYHFIVNWEFRLRISYLCFVYKPIKMELKFSKFFINKFNRMISSSEVLMKHFKLRINKWMEPSLSAIRTDKNISSYRKNVDTLKILHLFSLSPRHMLAMMASLFVCQTHIYDVMYHTLHGNTQPKLCTSSDEPCMLPL